MDSRRAQSRFSFLNRDCPKGATLDWLHGQCLRAPHWLFYSHFRPRKQPISACPPLEACLGRWETQWPWTKSESSARHDAYKKGKPQNGTSLYILQKGQILLNFRDLAAYHQVQKPHQHLRQSESNKLVQNLLHNNH
jgi:hypothetical protein